MSIQVFPHIKDIWDRITLQRAYYLDNLNGLTPGNLDATVSSRSTSVEVAKATVCTTARLGVLDNDMSLAPPVTTVSTDRRVDASSLSKPDSCGLMKFNDSVNGIHTQEWRTLVSCASPSKGTLQFIAVHMSDGGSAPAEANGAVRLYVDGNIVVHQDGAAFTSGHDRGLSIVGGYNFSTTEHGLAMGVIPFSDSWRIDWYTGASGTGYNMSVNAWVQYYLLSGTPAA